MEPITAWFAKILSGLTENALLPPITVFILLHQVVSLANLDTNFP